MSPTSPSGSQTMPEATKNDSLLLFRLLPRRPYQVDLLELDRCETLTERPYLGYVRHLVLKDFSDCLVPLQEEIAAPRQTDLPGASQIACAQASDERCCGASGVRD